MNVNGFRVQLRRECGEYRVIVNSQPTRFRVARNGNESARSLLAWTLFKDGYREPFDEANTRGELVRAAVKLETEA